VLDDDRRKAMPAIGDRNHDRTLPPDPPSSQAVTLTKPAAAMRPIMAPTSAQRQALLTESLPTA
jgi:hypothetical protein